MGKAHRGRRLGKSKTAIQREALPDFFPAGHQADPVREGRGDAEFESGPSLSDQTPPHEDIRGISEGVGNQTWISFVLLILRTNSALPELVVVATLASCRGVSRVGSQDLARKGGTMQMVQLWVNLRAKDKSAKPAYQTLLKAQIPNLGLPQEAGTVRFIAGEYGGQKGPAKTFTPINLCYVNLRAGKSVELPLPDGHTITFLVLND